MSFYCQKVCGEVDFSIAKWNETYQSCLKAGLSDAEINKILSEEPCKTQCETCMNIVIETKQKNRIKHGF